MSITPCRSQPSAETPDRVRCSSLVLCCPLATQDAHSEPLVYSFLAFMPLLSHSQELAKRSASFGGISCLLCISGSIAVADLASSIVWRSVYRRITSTKVTITCRPKLLI